LTEGLPGGESRPALPDVREHEPHYVAELRERVLSELSIVQGRVALASHLEPSEAKEQLRLAHSSQRASLLEDSAEWLSEREASLIQHFADGSDIDPSRIDPIVTPVRTQQDADLFRFASLTWSVPVSSGYGRRSRFIVRDRQNGKLMAIFALGDPVIAQSARDRAIGWNTEQRNRRLYNVYDGFVLGAVEPYRQLIAGKLVALLALSNETRDFLTHKYMGSTTGIRQEQKDPTPVLITTSSALGRSSIYNRLTYQNNLMFHSVGMTKGFGHFQFSETLFDELREYARSDVFATRDAKAGSAVYGSGPNYRFRIIRNALKSLGIPEESLQHNVRREVFLAPTAANWDAYLRGETDEYEQFDLPAQGIGEYWRERWAIGRAERRPGFALWRRDESRLTPLLAAARSVRGLPTRTLSGRVDLGPYSLSVGLGREKIRGTTPNGTNTDGVAYLSRLEGPDLMLTLADIAWSNGEREVRGWDRHESDPSFQGIIGRLRIGIHESKRFRGMSSAELRIVKVGGDGKAAQAYKTDTAELSALVGFDLAASFDDVGEAMVGTRGSLLGEEGVRKNQLAVAFGTVDHVIPALVWSLTRAIPFSLQVDPNSRQPTPPSVVRRPPTDDDLPVHDSVALA
jgi:hypothetical protein